MDSRTPEAALVVNAIVYGLDTKKVAFSDFLRFLKFKNIQVKSNEPHSVWDEHSEQARAPHTHELRDVPRCWALSLLQELLHLRGFSRVRAQPLCTGPWPSCFPRPRFGSRDT
jgi:hypothetical protein